MKVYLDNNIIVSLENRDYTFKDLLSILPSDQATFFYSYAHVFEVQSFEGNSKISRQEMLNKRFSTIRNVFRNNYLSLDFNNDIPTQKIEDPQEVYDTINPESFGIASMKSFVNLFSKEIVRSYFIHMKR